MTSGKTFPPRFAAVPALVTCVLPVLCFVLMAACVERPFAFQSVVDGRSRRAAVAIRDDVIAFQKWGTRAFTEPYLEKHYGRVWYMTASRADPKRDELIRGLAEALSEFESVDLFLLAHANQYVNWVGSIDPALRARIRLVYNTGCGDAAQADVWLRLGADAYVGHPGESNSPVFFFYFLRRWVRGLAIRDAASESNALMERALGYERLWGVSGESIRAEFENSRAIWFGRDDLGIGG